MGEGRSVGIVLYGRVGGRGGGGGRGGEKEGVLVVINESSCHCICIIKWPKKKLISIIRTNNQDK